eukprot:3312077-Rhodomonas_salina.1
MPAFLQCSTSADNAHACASAHSRTLLWHRPTATRVWMAESEQGPQACWTEEGGAPLCPWGVRRQQASSCPRNSMTQGRMGWMNPAVQIADACADARGEARVDKTGSCRTQCARHSKSLKKVCVRRMGGERCTVPPKLGPDNGQGAPLAPPPASSADAALASADRASGPAC